MFKRQWGVVSYLPVFSSPITPRVKRSVSPAVVGGTLRNIGLRLFYY
ncbi:hypothetical protein I5654_15175 [Hafnia paralvei]|nr:hypothetical protein [Hafnia paralvei]MBU2674003.1 hypothetical protein [Hafnia paralvei]